MDQRALLRRAFPYLVIGIGGFALAYVIIFVFVLPSKIVPPKREPYNPDTASVLKPIDTTVQPPPFEPPVPQATVPMAVPPAQTSNAPVDVPDLEGMALADARAVLNSYRLQATVRRDTSSFQPPNTVLRQSPAPGTRLSPGGAVTLTVSYFPPEKSADSAPRALPESLPPARPVTDTTRSARRRPLPPIIPVDTGVPARPVKPATPPVPSEPTTPPRTD